MMEYTPAQRAALRYPDGNLLLSASAGSGKTATLTERILFLLENERATLSEMLIVTYTRAAAAELRARIGKKILERAGETGSRRMHAHLAALPGAEISTIHAFLYRTLRPSFASLGLSPDFTIGEEGVILSLREEAMRDTIDDFFDADATGTDGGAPGAATGFALLADVLGGGKDAEKLDKALLSLYLSLAAAGQSPASLTRYAGTLEEAAAGEWFASPLSEPVRAALTQAAGHYREALTELSSSFDKTAMEKYGPACADLLALCRSLETAREYETVRTLLQDHEYPRLGTLAAKYATEATVQFKAVREACKKEFAAMQAKFFSDTQALLADSLRRSAAVLREAAVVLTRFAETFRQKKAARRYLDYTDIETLAARLLLTPTGEPTAAARELGARYKYIFIDEYQDTNHLQDALFRALGEHAVRFMVGDSKQSIYRFRGAEPSVFARYRRCWPSLSPEEAAAWAQKGAAPGAENGDGSRAPAEDGRCLFLRENFRCARPVVDFVNLVSDTLFPRSEMPYAPAEDALLCGRTDPAGTPSPPPVEICLIEGDAGWEDAAADGDGTADDTASGGDREAEWVAERILQMLGTETIAGRPVRPDDIAILLRSPDASGAAFQAALAKRGIPVRTAGTALLFTSPAVLLTLCLLHTADNPLDDVYLAGAMHSPLFGFTTDDLLCLRRFLKESMPQAGRAPLYFAVELALTPRDEWDALLPQTDDTNALPDDADMLSNIENILPDIENSENSLPDDAAGEAVFPPALLEKCVYFYRTVDELRALSRSLPADRFLDALYNRFFLFDMPEVAGNPAERENLLHLYDIARRYESGAFGGIAGFLLHVENLAAREREKPVSEEIPAVSILSIHRSKGLEYPVVFVSACAKKRNSRDEDGDVLFDPALGVGLRLPDPGGFTRCSTALRAAVAEKKRTESIDEEMRVLYVALTRARDRLIVTARVRDSETVCAHARETAPFCDTYLVRREDTYLSWILFALYAHGGALPDFCRLTTARAVQRAGETAEAAATAAPTAEAISRWEEIFRQNLDFSYPYAYLAFLPAKTPVSALSPTYLDDLRGADGSAASPAADGGAETARSLPSSPAAPLAPSHPGAEKNTAVLPRFMTGAADPATPADRGTATHLFLQFADFSLLADKGVQAALEALVQAHYLTDALASLVWLEEIARFRESDLFRRMRAAPLLRREFRFNAALPAWRFTADPARREALRQAQIPLLVQGVVDCVFRDTDGGLTLLDYKTDRPSAANPREAALLLRQRHHAQLSYYREICTALFEEPVSHTILYATALGQEIAIPPDDAASV